MQRLSRSENKKLRMNTRPQLLSLACNQNLSTLFQLQIYRKYLLHTILINLVTQDAELGLVESEVTNTMAIPSMSLLYTAAKHNGQSKIAAAKIQMTSIV
jgi:hypothetical protein